MSEHSLHANDLYKEKPERKVVIEATGIHKKYRVYRDKGYSLKEKVLFWKRNRYEERWVLRGVNLSVRQGEAVGLLGVNGCGKSTFLKLLSRIMSPNEGQITIDGRVSCLIELGAGFHPDLSGRENIYTNAAIFGLTKKEIDARLQDIIKFSELGDYIDNPVRTYSSGMYMRLAFSVAINVDADILLIDEIMAVGDANFQEKCFKKLRQLKRDGMTIVIVSHDINTIESFCDKGIWISEGKCASEGDIKKVVKDYRNFLDKERQAALAKEMEERRKDAKLRIAEGKADFVPAAFLDENAGEEDVDYGHNRFGLGHAVITDVVMRDHEGKMTSVFMQGKPCSMEIHYKINKEGKEYIFGMAFVSSDNYIVYGTNQRRDESPTMLPSSVGRVTFNVHNMNLAPGRYIFSVSIIDDKEVPMDFYRNYCEFEVVSDHKNVGVIQVDHDWTIEGDEEDDV
ncbi:MAG: ABC transporter ATP-binding protein [Clostridiales bacterium]|nr:ABC transporter ATP-binding protein [Clostridiales bacterium]